MSLLPHSAAAPRIVRPDPLAPLLRGFFFGGAGSRTLSATTPSRRVPGATLPEPGRACAAGNGGNMRREFLP